MHGDGGHGQGFPSSLAVSMGNATLADKNKAPNINALTKMFFIDFSPRMQKLLDVSFSQSVSIPYNPLTLMGFSESGTDFSQNGNLEEE